MSPAVPLAQCPSTRVEPRPCEFPDQCHTKLSELASAESFFRRHNLAQSIEGSRDAFNQGGRDLARIALICLNARQKVVT